MTYPSDQITHPGRLDVCCGSKADIAVPNAKYPLLPFKRTWSDTSTFLVLEASRFDVGQQIHYTLPASKGFTERRFELLPV
jgi:hypothetical protein